ncbi:hypothetical protein G3T14_01745 [Methylobacterium sp. BTF04]|uniref:hypothetical protein n=1 Tax=Methylobacterium sp. BTF04 TaxID=2708300 RepID=UPI0013D6BD8F|nr:hypothetical protein [Methylobacterium sp. BTF04]NEU10855.1 hypothetical protein [Methylobacterium sp. BTF04]
MIPPAGSPRPRVSTGGPDSEASPAGLIETLSRRLLSGHSATAILEAWCVERGLSGPAIVAERVDGADRALDEDRQRLFQLAPGETLRYRRVRLSCGPHTLSEADNWYVPARLTREMNRLLDATQLPFGRVVHPLAPTRRNLDLRLLWSEGTLGPDDALFAIEALLSTPDGIPFCEVHETYLGAVLDGR